LQSLVVEPHVEIKGRSVSVAFVPLNYLLIDEIRLSDATNGIPNLLANDLPQQCPHQIALSIVFPKMTSGHSVQCLTKCLDALRIIGENWRSLRIYASVSQRNEQDRSRSQQQFGHHIGTFRIL
jgi:hypothetical protein